ncbi:enoyl-CoA hydratase-related protein [Aquisalimonas sp.]|uniref:enoyl-CoA hydratase-related protein n=1 Tax=unclassified Aquisalimonas TaxID=2644645 RepID=UPI0025B81E3D|nr:enoyl-CoA hydratase-related protein [Aquisalimonas sp.]
MSSTFETITLERADGIAWLTLNRPDKRNALSIPMQEEMRAALAEVAADTGVRALVITGAGDGFCAGAELDKLWGDAGEQSFGDAVGDVMDRLSHPLICDIQALPVPVVAAVNGAAAGAGASLALAADVVLARRSAYFLLPFVPNLGILPDLGATWHMPRLIGRARALGLTLLGDRLPAEDAANWGLIWACTDDDALLDDARAVASRLAAGPPDVVRRVREAFAASEHNSLPAQLDYEGEHQRGLLNRDAFHEGVAAFMEKRAPRFGERGG